MSNGKISIEFRPGGGTKVIEHKPVHIWVPTQWSPRLRRTINSSSPASRTLSGVNMI